MMDGQPDRCLTTQDMFGLVEKHARILQQKHTEHIEIELRTPSSFPTIPILSAELGRELVCQIVRVGGEHIAPQAQF